MIHPEAIKELVTFFAKHFGKDLLVLATETLKGNWARMFHSKPIIFLGPKSSGKSSLIAFLCTGKPYDIEKDGTIRTPDPTLIAAVVDKKVSVQQKKWLRIKQDLPGDKQLRDAWKQAVDDFHPVGIVYLIDGNDESKVQKEVQAACREIFDTCYPDGPRELCAVHIFISFSDQWGHSSIARRSRQHAARNTLEEELDVRPAFSGVHTDVAVVHLSPHTSEWKDVTRALEHFGTDLVK